MRPQFGSPPWMAVLTRLLEATARAASRACSSSAAPVTRTVISLVAPSPSRAIIRASSLGTSLSASYPGAGARFEAPAPPPLDYRAQPPRRHSGIGREIGQHRRHVGMDHAGALAH